MSHLEQTDTVVVEQDVEKMELFTDFEQNNTYRLKNKSGSSLGIAEEEQTGFLAKNVLQSSRPFEINVYGPDERVMLTVERPFRFYFETIDIFDEHHEQIGSVTRQFSVFRNQFKVTNEIDQREYTISGPFFQPWTFQIQRNDREVEKITKEWSGVGKEMFTDEDQFAVEFLANVDPHEKKIFLGATFLIDFMYFEGGND